MDLGLIDKAATQPNPDKTSIRILGISLTTTNRATVVEISTNLLGNTLGICSRFHMAAPRSFCCQQMTGDVEIVMPYRKSVFVEVRHQMPMNVPRTFML